ncbi:MAG: polysaccharide deacetylase family protein [Verrucomicrobiales bacterium]
MFGHFWLGLAIMMAAHALALYATLVPNCQWWGPVVTRFETREREVWLTIDDGPDPRDLGKMLELLKAHEAQATFFLIGGLAQGSPREVRAILDAGHEIGHHTYTHPETKFWRLGPRLQAWELDHGTNAYRRAADAPPEMRPRVFRAPVGMRNPFLHPQLRTRGLTLVGWTARGLDGKDRAEPLDVLDRLKKGIKPGAILVIHEGRDHSLDVLRLLLIELSTQGYRCVIPAAEQLR